MSVVTRRTGEVSGRAFTPPSQAPARRHKPDYWLLILGIVLLAIGLVVVYAISPALAIDKHVGANYYVTRQVIAILLGVVIFGVTSRIPFGQWRRWYMILLGAAGLATLLALAMPVNADYPAHRWVRLGSLSFQSVELLKFALLISLAGFLADRMLKGETRDMKKTLRPLAFGLAGTFLVVAGVQSDLGSMGVIVLMSLAMMFVAGLPMRKLMLGLLALGVLVFVAVSSTPYRRARLQAFLHPASNCQTTGGYQACQALISVGSGGAIGLGLGRGVQAYGYVPEPENDSIFAIYAEKFGFVGCLVLLALFLAFFMRIKRIVDRAPDNFSRLVAIGALTWLSMQTFINIGAMVGLLPLKGITLPLISYGGSSVLLVMAILGVLFQISRYTLYNVPGLDDVNGGNRYENSRDGRRLRGAYHPDLGSSA